MTQAEQAPVLSRSDSRLMAAAEAQWGERAGVAVRIRNLQTWETRSLGADAPTLDGLQVPKEANGGGHPAA